MKTENIIRQLKLRSMKLWPTVQDSIGCFHPAADISDGDTYGRQRRLAKKSKRLYSIRYTVELF